MSLTRRHFAVVASAGLLLPATVPAQQANAAMRLRCRFGDQDFRYRLLDNPTVRDLVSLLPMELMIEDFSTNEKLAHLPRRLDERVSVPIIDEAPGDLCYFLGWGNLAFFHGGYRYRNDLIRLGQIEGRIDPLLVRGRHPLRLDILS